jgi:crotonobetainyl-CoA:carnitine CoA-transferase CaiB-like acyl-CoA transferase
MSGALTGFRILDMTNFIAGPVATTLLADMGADVIKVESPPVGDPMRFREGDAGYTSSFAAVNRGKRSLLLDFQSQRSHDIFDRLLATTDAIVISIRPRSRRKLRIGYDDLAARFPRLVYCSISGYGEAGATLDRPAFDTTAQAISGLMSLTGVDFDRPLRTRALFADQLTGVYASYGVLAALLARQRTGVGQYVSTSLLESCLAFSGMNFAHYFSAVNDPKLATSLTMRTAGFVFECADGLPIAVHLTPEPPKIWLNLTEAVGRTDLRDDPRFGDKGSREQNYGQLYAILLEEFRAHPRAYWISRLEEYDLACAPVNGLGEVFDDPLVRELGKLVPTPNPFGGQDQLVGNAVNMSATPPDVSRRAPLLDEHTDELLQELGFTSSEIEAYQAETGPRKRASSTSVATAAD